MQISVTCVRQGYTGIAKEHPINKTSIVMVVVVGKFKIMRSGPKPVTVVYLFG